MTTKIATTNIQDSALTTLLGPKVTTIVYPGDDTATDTAGGATINLTGNGFQSGCSVLVASTASSVVSFISSTQISFVAPALSAGTYVIYVINPDGGTAISIPGISYSGTPNWTTVAGSLGTIYETSAISATLTATGDAPITYTLASGTLPTGSTLNSNGTLSGTASATASATTYSFTIKATDAQNQDTNRAFSITVNPDVVTWSSPANSTTYEVFTDSAIANVEMSATSASGGSITYTADTLPTGVSITGANIAGTPTVAASTSTTLTATSTSTRSATRTINWVVSIANDIYFKNTTLLLNGETTVTPFISDSSTNSFALTINGDTKPVLFNPYQGDGYYGAYFNGSSYVDVTVSSAPVPSTGQFTVEGWIYTTASATQIIYSQYTSANSSRWMFLIDNSSGYKLSVAHGTAATVFGSTVVPLNQWNHVALTRDASNVLRIFLNGVLDGSQSSYTSTLQQYDPRIGYYNNVGSVYFNGYISNLRAINGTAQYTASFTPPTTPLTAISGTSFLGFQSNRLIDKSTNGHAIINTGVQISPNMPFTQNSSYSTYGSTYFDGTGDYLSAPSNSAFAFGTGDFTLECWIYVSSPSDTPIYEGRTSGDSSLGFTLTAYSSTVIRIFCGSVLISATVANYTNQWTHVAVVKNSGTTTLYVNGVSGGTTASLGNLTDAQPLIGAGRYTSSASPNAHMLGYISNFRIVKGTAVYTSAFTPSITPLTSIANTSLLTLQYNGNVKNSNFIDNSNFNNTITRAGNVTQGSFSPYSVTGWSNYFGGSSYLSIPTNTALDLGTGDYTIEGWWYFSDTSNQSLVSKYGPGGYGFVVQYQSGNLRMVLGSSGTDNVYSFSWTPSINTWYHVTITRSGTNGRAFINGTQIGSTQTFTTTTNTASTNALQIGLTHTVSEYTRGYVSNFRLVKGTALYTTTFTPSTTPLTAIANTSLLTCQSNRLIDNSPNSFTLTPSGTPSIQALDPFGSVPEAVPISYSNFFDGTGDWLTFTSATTGSGNFTTEVWINLSSLKDYQVIFDNRATAGTSTGYALGVDAAGKPYLYTNSGFQILSSIIIGISTWNHLALVRSGTTITLYVNGVSGGTYTSSANFSDTNNGIGIAPTYTPTSQYFGYISNLRIVNGTAVYTSAFTPSTTPLTAIANTSLLTCQSTRMIDNSTNNFTLTAAGDVKPRIFNPFGYTAQSTTSYTPSLHGGSAYFDGTTDYLTAASNSVFGYGTGDFTIEFWLNPNSTGLQTVFSNLTSVTSINPHIYIDTTIRYFTNNGDRITGSTLSIGQWHHIALCRASGSTRLFINGTQSGTTYADSNNYGVTAPLGIGTYWNSGSPVTSNTVNGYLSDIRVVKGTAIYTSNFVPPTQALTNYSNSIPASLLLNFNNGGIIDQHSTNVIETVGSAQLSTSVKKYNVASVYLGGSGNYLQLASTTNLDFSTGDFTIECWVYSISIAANYPTFISSITGWSSGASGHRFNNTGYANKFWFGLNGSGGVNGGDPFMASSNTFSFNTWYHYALTRSGNTWRMFVNGNLENTQTFSGAYNPSLGGMRLGYSTWDGANGWFNGYLDDLRFTKGYARYTANFTAPTSALITK